MISKLIELPLLNGIKTYIGGIGAIVLAIAYLLLTIAGSEDQSKSVEELRELFNNGILAFISMMGIGIGHKLVKIKETLNSK